MTADDDVKGTGTDPLIGTQLGNFRVEERIASGGMGLIYRAVHVVIGRQAAIKVLSGRYSRDKSMIKRLHREARAVNRIGHPNIVDIFDFGRTPDKREYFVMEYLDGESLAQIFERRGRQPWSFSRQVLAQILDALGAAHSHGIIHRDVKPENVLVVQKDGEINAKVLDFGIAKAVGVGPLGEQLTRAGSVMGTPEHIAPEQIRGKDIDGRADIYSMGTILYEMIGGQRPFESEDVVALLMKHLKDPIPELPDIPEELGVPEEAKAATLKAMAKDRDDRFPDAHAFAQALGLPTRAISAADGTRPLPAMFWQMDASQSTGHTQDSISGPAAMAETLVESEGPDTSAIRQPPPAEFADEPIRTGPPLRIIIPLAALFGAGVAVAGVAILRHNTKPARTRQTQPPPIERVGAKRPHSFPPVKDLRALAFKVREALREGLRQPDPRVRRAATRGLGDLAEDDAKPLLVKRLRDDPDPGVRAAAALAVASLGDTSVVSTLHEARQESPEQLRVWVDEALVRLGSSRGKVGLRAALSSKDAQVRFAAALALAESGDKQAIPVLKPLLAQASTEKLAAALYALARLDQEAARKTLQEGIARPNRSVRLHFAEALAKLGDQRATEVLHELLEGDDLPTRLMAARSLASHGDDVGVGLLLDSAAAKEARIRMLALVGLGAVADRAALPALSANLDDENTLVRAASAESAARVLSMLPRELLRRSQNWVLAALDNRDWSMRHVAVGVTSEMDPELAVDLLAWAYRDKDARVRAAAIARLGKLRRTPDKAIRIIRAGLSDKDPEVRRTAAVALRKAAGAKARPLLVQVVHDKTPTVGITAAGQLLAMGDTSYLPDLTRASRASNAHMRATAIDAIGQWDDDKAVPLLLAALKDRSEKVRVTAALGLAHHGNKAGVPVLAAASRSQSHRPKEVWRALVKLDALEAKDLRQSARSKAPRTRAMAMGQATPLLGSAKAWPLLARGSRDSDPGVRRTAAGELARIAMKQPEALRVLYGLRKDPDPAVRVIAAVAVARAGGKPADLGEVKPARPAPVPKAAALPKAPAPKQRGQSGQALWIEDNNRNRIYKQAIGQAAVLESRGRYGAALKRLHRAQRANNRASVYFEIGKMRLKLALKHRKKPSTAALHLRKADQAFRTCLSKQPNAKLASKAKRGLSDVRQMKRALR